MSARTTAAAIATLPVVLHALTSHMLTHRLPAPQDIDSRTIRDRGIQLYLHSDEVQAWLDSGFVETRRVVRPISGPRVPFEAVDIDGLLATAIGDVKVRITFVRQTARPVLRVAGVGR